VLIPCAEGGTEKVDLRHTDPPDLVTINANNVSGFFHFTSNTGITGTGENQPVQVPSDRRYAGSFKNSSRMAGE